MRFYFDDGPESQRFDIDRLLEERSREGHIYVCGPKPFIEWTLANARRAGWREEWLHREFFRVDANESAERRSFTVKIASTGQLIVVSAGESVVEALRRCGVRLNVSCEQGVCGTCLTRIIEGVPDHRDVYLTDEEHAANDQFTPCCSRAKSALLILDL